MAAWSRTGEVLRYCAGVGLRSLGHLHAGAAIADVGNFDQSVGHQLTLQGKLPALHVGGSRVRVEERDAPDRGWWTARRSAGRRLEIRRETDWSGWRHEVSPLSSDGTRSVDCAEARLVDVHIDHAERVEEDPVAAAHHGHRRDGIGEADARHDQVLVGSSRVRAAGR